MILNGFLDLAVAVVHSVMDVSIQLADVVRSVVTVETTDLKSFH